MTEDSSISTSLFDDASYCSGELTTNSYTVTQIYHGYVSPGVYIDPPAHRNSSGSDIYVHSKRSVREEETAPIDNDESRSESTFCATMDTTQVSGCEKTTAIPVSISLRISYDKPKICWMDYRKVSNILAILLFALVICEFIFIHWATNIPTSQYFQFFEQIDPKFPVFFTFTQYCLTISLFFILPHFVLVCLKDCFNNSSLSTFFSLLTVISLVLAEKFLWNGYHDSSLDSGTIRKVSYALFIHSFNLLYSLAVLVSSIISMFVEYKASTYAIAY